LIDSPLVSIVVPCHNAERWVADAIHSALAQTHTATEVIVVDDGSIDGSGDIIRSFDEHIKFKFIDHYGAAHARNRGVQMASGEFIQFLDADDILFPHCVKRKMEVAWSEKADVVYSGGFFFNLEANTGTYESHAPPKNDLPGLAAHIIRSSLVTTILLCRRDRLLRIGGFDEQLTNGQEHDLLLRLALTGAKFAYVPKALSCNRTNHNFDSITSVTQQQPDRLEKLFCRFETMLKNADLWVPPVRAALAWRFHRTGVNFMALRDRERAIAMFDKAMAIEPNYISELPLPRRLLVPIWGGYTAEKLLTKLRQTTVRLGIG
jgi:glycosyltransferase involved in cell wall biosynthesis